MKFKDKVVLITGAGRGIGRAAAEKFASEGAKLYLNDINAEELDLVVNHINTNTPGTAVACSGNITDPDFPNRFVYGAFATYDDWDVIINNAGVAPAAYIQDIDDSTLDFVLDVNFKAPFRILRVAQPLLMQLIARERASKNHDEKSVFKERVVINVSSVVSHYGGNGQADYGASKGAVEAMTRCLAKEWAKYNVRVNCIAPAMTLTTPIINDPGVVAPEEHGERKLYYGLHPALQARLVEAIPRGRAAEPEEIANAMYILALPEAGHISGQIIPVTGGLTTL
jgi:3-oxoacyl-[acyl-carrier protein] reductase